MKLDGEYVFAASVQDVWDALFDPAVLAAVLPGCEKLELVDGSYVGGIKVKVGPISGSFTGKVDLLDKVEPERYRMNIDGRGPQGFVQATASISLAALGDGTRMRYESEAQVGGKIATVGQRLVETSAKAIVKQSLEGLHENIKIRASAYKEHRAAQVAVEPAPAPEPTAAEPTAPPTAAEPTAPAAPATTAPAASPPEVAAPTPPAIEYKRADAGKLAATVAKEVTKTLAPYLVAGVVVIAIIIYLLVR